jgi:uncharacterized membrane protein
MTEIKTQSTLNIDESISRPLCYLPILGVLLSVVFLILERNRRVKWDALQAIMLWVFVVILDAMLRISYVARGAIPLVNLLGMIVAPLILAIKANQGQDTKIPIIADLVNSLLVKAREKVK